MSRASVRVGVVCASCVYRLRVPQWHEVSEWWQLEEWAAGRWQGLGQEDVLSSAGGGLTKSRAVKDERARRRRMHSAAFCGLVCFCQSGFARSRCSCWWAVHKGGILSREGEEIGGFEFRRAWVSRWRSEKILTGEK